MKRQHTLCSTTIGVYLSLNVQVQKDNGRPGLMTIPLLSLTGLLLWAWRLSMLVNQAAWQASYMVNRFSGWFNAFSESLGLASALCSIGFRSVLYGAGLPV